MVVSSVKLLCNRVIDIQIQYLLISKALHSYIYTYGAQWDFLIYVTPSPSKYNKH